MDNLRISILNLTSLKIILHALAGHIFVLILSSPGSDSQLIGLPAKPRFIMM